MVLLMKLFWIIMLFALLFLEMPHSLHDMVFPKMLLLKENPVSEIPNPLFSMLFPEMLLFAELMSLMPSALLFFTSLFVMTFPVVELFNVV
jgi:hypothetical protein